MAVVWLTVPTLVPIIQHIVTFSKFGSNVGTVSETTSIHFFKFLWNACSKIIVAQNNKNGYVGMAA